jgi:hypothetical protein
MLRYVIRYGNQRFTAKNVDRPLFESTQVVTQTSVSGRNQNNENATFRSTDGRHQYFILDKNVAGVDIPRDLSG